MNQKDMTLEEMKAYAANLKAAHALSMAKRLVAAVATQYDICLLCLLDALASEAADAERDGVLRHEEEDDLGGAMGWAADDAVAAWREKVAENSVENDDGALIYTDPDTGDAFEVDYDSDSDSYRLVDPDPEAEKRFYQ